MFWVGLPIYRCVDTVTICFLFKTIRFPFALIIYRHSVCIDIVKNAIFCDVPRIVENKCSEQKEKKWENKLEKQINVIAVHFCVLIYSQSGVGVKNNDWAHRTHLNFAFTTHWNTHHSMLLKSCIIESIQRLITTMVILAWLRLTFLIPCYWFNKILNFFYMHFLHFYNLSTKQRIEFFYRM